uniref:Pre-mRNA-processing factor 19 n=1 Tax=Ditylenchus dipsaci TaxID=166011 RepID=A0A915CQF8_9BILA
MMRSPNTPNPNSTGRGAPHHSIPHQWVLKRCKNPNKSKCVVCNQCVGFLSPYESAGVARYLSMQNAKLLTQMVISARQDNWAPNIGTSKSMNDMPITQLIDLQTPTIVDSSSSTNSSAPSTPACFLSGANICQHTKEDDEEGKFRFPEPNNIPIPHIILPTTSGAQYDVNTGVESQGSDCTLKLVSSDDGSEKNEYFQDSQSNEDNSSKLNGCAFERSHKWDRKSWQMFTIRGHAPWKDVTIPFREIKIFPDSLIGHGRFGVVHKVDHFGTVAIKFLNMNHVDEEKRLEVFKQDTACFQNARHDNLVFFRGYTMDRDCLGIVMEFIKGQPLYTLLHDDDAIKKPHVDFNDVVELSKQICQAISYLHTKRILHKDLRSKNVFVKDRKVPGAGSVSDHTLFLCLTIGFAIWHLNFDVYAFGSIWYELLTHTFPFSSLPPDSVMWQVGNGMKSALTNVNCCREAKMLLMQCWSYLPKPCQEKHEEIRPSPPLFPFAKALSQYFDKAVLSCFIKLENLSLIGFCYIVEMSSFTCAISGTQAEVPVVSPCSGEVFEKRLIVKYIEENGTDPISNEKLDVSQLVDLKIDPSNRALHRSLSTVSMPLLLKTLQDEWDAVMLNSFTLRQELKTAREELTHTLYQNDAACRVINRLSSELQSARQILATLPHGRPTETQETVEMEVTEDVGGRLPGISETIIVTLQDKATAYSSARKLRGKKLPEGLASVDDIKQYVQTSCQDGIHNASAPGITALDIQKDMVLTGGSDKNVILFNMGAETIENTFKGHQKKITAVVMHPNQKVFVSGSQDSQIRIWGKDSESARQVIGIHDKAVTDISLHPTGDYILSSSLDSFWSLVDLNAGRALTKVKSSEDENSKGTGISSIEFHPDGLIFGTGSEDAVGSVRAISFSENGYYLATGAEDGEVKIWDLRKLTNFKTLVINDGKHPLNALCFDQSGQYLAVAGSDTQVIHVKTWSVVARFEENNMPVTGVRFGENAKFVVSTSLDKTLRIRRWSLEAKCLDVIVKKKLRLTDMKDGLIDLVSGTAAGVACVYAGQPLDTVKVKMQAFPAIYGNWGKCFNDTYRIDGIRGLYAGTLPSLAANVSENAVLFTAYGYCQKMVAWLVGKKDVSSMNPVENAISGSCAAVFASAVLCPTELIKCQLQSQRELHKGKKHGTPFSVCRDMYRARGYRAFFVGMTPTLLREVPGYFFFFGGYETCRYFFSTDGKSKNEIGVVRTAISGSVGGMLLWSIIFPADVVKSRMQVSGGGRFTEIWMDIYKNEGVYAFYKGLSPTLIRTCLASSCLFLAYENTKRFLNSVL